MVIAARVDLVRTGPTNAADQLTMWAVVKEVVTTQCVTAPLFTHLPTFYEIKADLPPFGKKNAAEDFYARKI